MSMYYSTRDLPRDFSNLVFFLSPPLIYKLLLLEFCLKFGKILELKIDSTP